MRSDHGTALNHLELWAQRLLLRKDMPASKPKLAAELQGKWHAVYCAKKNPTLKASAKDYAFVAKICNTSVKELRSKVRAWAKTRKGTICGAIRFGDAARAPPPTLGRSVEAAVVEERRPAKIGATPVHVNNKNDSGDEQELGRWALAGSGPGRRSPGIIRRRRRRRRRSGGAPRRGTRRSTRRAAAAAAASSRRRPRAGFVGAKASELEDASTSRSRRSRTAAAAAAPFLGSFASTTPRCAPERARSGGGVAVPWTAREEVMEAGDDDDARDEGVEVEVGPRAEVPP